MNSPPNVDKNTLIAAQKHNVAAFEKIYHTYEQAIIRHVHRFVQHTPDIEDISQDIFIKVYDSIVKFDVNKSFSPWIYKIATNTIYDWLRKKQIRQFTYSLDDDNERGETIPDTHTYYDIEAKNDLDTALSQIDPKYRTILLLYYKDGFQYEEIADILSLPLNTVKTHLHRARNHLKNALEGNRTQ